MSLIIDIYLHPFIPPVIGAPSLLLEYLMTFSSEGFMHVGQLLKGAVVNLLLLLYSSYYWSTFTVIEVTYDGSNLNDTLLVLLYLSWSTPKRFCKPL